MNGFTAQQPGASNDVWGTLADTAASIFREREASKIRIAEIRAESEAIARTRAAPSGDLSWWQRNPLPGMFSPYPQADTKPAVGSGFVLSGQQGILWLIAGVIAVLLLLRYAR